VIAEWLGLDAATIETLCRNGVLEPLSDETRAAATSHVEAV